MISFHPSDIYFWKKYFRKVPEIIVESNTNSELSTLLLDFSASLFHYHSPLSQA